MKFSFKGLSGKLILFLAIVAFSVIILSAYLIIQAANVENKTYQIETIRYPVSSRLENINYQLSQLLDLLRESVDRKDTTGAIQRTSTWASLTGDIEFIKQNASGFSSLVKSTIDSIDIRAQQLQEYDQLIDNWILNNYVQAPDDSTFLAQRAEREERELTPYVAGYQKAAERFKSLLGDLSYENAIELKETIDEIEKTSYRTTIIGLSAGGFIIILLFAGGYLIITRFNNSLDLPIEVLNKLVNGEIPEDVKSTGDELGKVLEASNKLSENLRQASSFARHIGEGDVDFQFQPVSENDVLGNSLIQMRSKLKEINEADKKRNWVTEGLTKFADIVRSNDDFQELSNIIITELIQYTGSNVGGLFVLNKEEENNQFLELKACYAYDRIKHLEKKVEVGMGLVGQCFIESKTFYLREIPQDYLTIKSGLGGAKPKNLLLVPLKINDITEGVIELASLREYEAHEIEFVQKVGEIVASTISSSRINERTKRLLVESQERSEELRAQEEEMRQNMEEMQTTQEQLQRQTNEMREVQEKLEVEKIMFHTLMDYMPDRITYKDRHSVIVRVNRAKAKRSNMREEDFVGKTDYDFFTEDHASKAMAVERELMDKGEPILDLQEKVVFSATGEVMWSNTSRIPFRNQQGEVIGMFVIAKDTTEEMRAAASLRDREKIIEQLLDNMAVLRYTIDVRGRIINPWKSKILDKLDILKIANTDLRVTFPEVYDLIHQEDMGDSNLVCKEVMEIEGEKEIFKHHVIKDSAYEGVYHCFAIKQV